MDKICFLPRQLGLGGPASFQARISEAFRAQGISTTFDPDDPGISALLVVGGTRHLEELRRVHHRGVRIVQRLNGMNWVQRRKRTGLKHYLRAEINNWILQTIRKNYADRIVYQSQFSQSWWQRVYGDVRADGTVIYNGVNLDEFTPLGSGEKPLERWRILLVEGHLGGGYEGGLLSAVKVTELLNQRMEHPVELMVVGDVPASLQAQIHSSAAIQFKGVVKRYEIPAIDRSAHVFFSADVNAACPNAVIEALACGLPAAGFDTGALPELLQNDAGRVAPYGGDPWKLDAPNTYALVDAIQEILRQPQHFSQSARQQAEAAFDIMRIAERYLEVLLGN